MIEVQANLSLIVEMAYVTPNTQFTFDLTDNIFQFNTPIIIRGDFNTKHRAWNNFYKNIRGIRLYNFLQISCILIIHSNIYSHRAPR